MTELVVAVRADQGSPGSDADPWPVKDESTEALLTQAVAKLTSVVNKLNDSITVSGSVSLSEGLEFSGAVNQGTPGPDSAPWPTKDEASSDILGQSLVQLSAIVDRLNDTLSFTGAVSQGAPGLDENPWPTKDDAAHTVLVDAVDRLSTIMDRLGETLDVAGTVDAQDSGEREYTPVIGSATSAGPTVIHTPAAGKRIRLRWITAINDPNAEESTKISIFLGAKGVYSNWVISKRQHVTGPIDGPLIVNLSVAGDVAVNAMIEEI